MRLKSKKAQLQYLLLKNKIVEYKKKENIQYHITAPTYHIPECLQGYQPAKRLVKKINQCKNRMSHVLVAAKIECFKEYRKTAVYLTCFLHFLYGFCNSGFRSIINNTTDNYDDLTVSV